MLSLGKIGSGKGLGSATYYVRSVADGAEDYYLGRGEAPGYWAGTAAKKLALSGEVDSSQFLSLMEGNHPQGDYVLYAGNARSVQAFDATFSAPKSISLLYGLSDPTVRDQVIEAHDAAVANGLAYLETHAAVSRAGAGGVDRVIGDGFAAAVFRHRTSRAGDPQLHSHVVVPNMIESPDGKWRTLDGRALYAEAKTAGIVYQAALRQELSQRLGIEFEVTSNGLSEIARFDRRWVEHFSRRSAEIAAEMDAYGMATWAQAEVAAQRTRQPKHRQEARDADGLERQRDYGVDPNSLYGQWSDRAAEVGLDREQLDRFIGTRRHQEPSPSDLARLAEELASASGLTRQHSTFARREVIASFATHIDTGLDTARLEAVADAFIVGDEILPTHASDQPSFGHDPGSLPHPDERRYTTTEMVETEQAVLDSAIARVDTQAAVIPTVQVDAFIARQDGIKADQAAAITQIATSGNGLDVLQAHAGTGKTWTLGRINDLYNEAGHHVIGLAAARTAVAEMTNEGIDSYTIAQLNHDLSRSQSDLPANCVVLIDEAAMISTRDFAQLLPDLERVGAKVVLAGDAGQLPEIGAGGVFGSLSRRLDSPELSEVIRQRDPAEIQALNQIRDKDIAAALEYHHTNDAIVVAADAATIRQRLAGDYITTSGQLNPDTGRPYTVMVFAPRREQVSQLNLDIRSHAEADGRLTGPAFTVPTRHDGLRPIQVGDEIRPTANWNAKGIINNDFGTVTNINHRDRSITFQPHRHDAEPVTLPATYLDDGNVDYGYARTVHGAQGGTCDKAFTLGDASTYNEMFYVQMSRHRDDVTIYATAPPPTLSDTMDSPIGHEPPEPDPLGDLTQAAQRTRAKALAIDSRPTANFPQLAEEARAMADKLRLIPPEQTPAIEHLTKKVEANDQRKEELSDKLREIGPPQRREPAATTAARNSLLDQHEEATGQTRDLRGRLALATDRQAERLDRLAQHAPDIARHAQIRHHLDTEVRYRLAAQEVRPSAYVVEALGPKPGTPSERAAWRSGAAAIERHRLEFGVTDEHTALGKRPRRPSPERTSWDTANAQIDRPLGRTSLPIHPPAASGLSR